MSGTDVSQLLKAWGAGDDEALEKLIPLVYDELHRRAHNFMKRERKGHTLQTGALINEAYLRLVELGDIEIQNRSHFLAIASQLMRQVLVDFARQRRAAKRGGGAFQAPLEEAGLAAEAPNAELLRLDDALGSLAEIDPRKSRIVVLRYFGGLDLSETARVLGISTRTVIREWNLARAWLYREVSRK
ncbi:MAG: sigma-70 family RNA polymerase sigma factor [Acidobacteriota bacterium]|nr:MAG: sigma-70 family RNA polymerase sigma factor [Acidobacteriota bacterium]